MIGVSSCIVHMCILFICVWSGGGADDVLRCILDHFGAVVCVYRFCRMPVLLCWMFSYIMLLNIHVFSHCGLYIAYVCIHVIGVVYSYCTFCLV